MPTQAEQQNALKKLYLQSDYFQVENKSQQQLWECREKKKKLIIQRHDNDTNFTGDNNNSSL